MVAAITPASPGDDGPWMSAARTCARLAYPLELAESASHARVALGLPGESPSANGPIPHVTRMCRNSAQHFTAAYVIGESLGTMRIAPSSVNFRKRVIQ